MADKQSLPADPMAAIAQLAEQVSALAKVVGAQAAQPSDADKLGAVVGEALAEANQRSRQWWRDELLFEDVSPLNPLGERLHPRPKLAREIFWVGFHMKESELTREEIDLLNQFVPGKYDLVNDAGAVERRQFFTIAEQHPGIPGSPLLVTFPCKTQDDQALMSRFDRGRAGVDLMQMLVKQMRKSAAVV